MGVAPPDRSVPEDLHPKDDGSVDGVLGKASSPPPASAPSYPTQLNQVHTTVASVPHVPVERPDGGQSYMSGDHQAVGVDSPGQPQNGPLPSQYAFASSGMPCPGRSADDGSRSPARSESSASSMDVNIDG